MAAGRGVGEPSLPLAGERFTAYGASHWAVLLIALTGAVVLVWVGRRHRNTANEDLFARTFAAGFLLFALVMQAYQLLPSQWDIRTSLPFHLSDLTWIAAACALWSRRRWAHALTYYWGLTLTTQALLTPALDSPDFPHVDFLDFWIQHVAVLWAAVYLTWGLGIRPNWRSYATAVAVTFTWGVTMLAFNELAETNYGFLNAKPAVPSVLDVMGAWPWYLLAELVAGLVIWALITWPWTFSRKRKTAPVKTVSPPVTQ